MILWFLNLFPQFRSLLGSAELLAKKLNEKDAEYQNEFNERIHAQKRAMEFEHLHSVAQSKITELTKDNANLDKAANHFESENKILRARAEAAEKRADEATRELVDALKTAGDSMALRATGRRLFSKAPVEAPPDTQADRPPINVSPGSNRPFAGDVARQKTAEFMRNAARQARVMPVADSVDVGVDDKKPN